MIEYPKLAATCSFHAFDNGGGSEEYVLATAGGRQFKVSGLACKILSRLDGRASIEEIAAQLNAEAVPITPDQLRALLEQRYVPLGVIEDGAASEPPAGVSRTTRKIGFPMLLTWNLVPSRVVAWASAGLRWLYAPMAILPLLGLIVWSHSFVYRTDLHAAALTSESYLRITLLCLLSILFHELGHAAAVSRFGGTPGAIGCGLYLLVPTFYADVSQLWRFPRRHRMVVDLGGAWFQQIAFAALALGAVRTGNPELLATCRLIDLMVMTALNPLFHFDGYWLLADYLAIPRLQSTAFRYLGWRLRRLTGRPAEPPKLPVMNRLARGVFLFYSILASAFLVATVWFVYHYLSTTLLRFPRVAPQAFHAVVDAFESGNVPLLLVRSISLFFLAAFPGTAVIGLVLYLVRLVRLCARWVARLAGRTPGGLLARRLT
jgi:putative peptide zinc metalloprotease protein